MTGRWVKSLPDVSGAPIEDLSGLAVMELGHAMYVPSPYRRVNSVRYAAAYVRAWRKSLPAESQGDRQSDWAEDAPTDVLLRRAVRYSLYAADGGELEGSWLRDAEAALRIVGKRLARESES